ncbi:MAG: sulfite exporter TauE/SafE family protein [Planctomycetes bacterium]|nr:sulfite exporter TauE/SafE family protein [Planctomycetota bacterium]
MPFEPLEFISLLTLGLVAGIVGGLVGLGGSIIIIPVLTLLVDRNQHVAQAAAMIVNVFIAVPALYRHLRAGAVRWEVAARMLPFGILLVLAGVEASNRVDAVILQRLFGIFLVYIVIFKLRQLYLDRKRTERPAPRLGWAQLGFVGGATGFMAGLLGIGGGPVSVPLLQRICRLPLRESIGGAAALMCLTAAFGAVSKNVALGSLGLSLNDSLALAAALAPTALIGALIGAGLTHDLPLRWVRVAFLVLIAWAGAVMLT